MTRSYPEPLRVTGPLLSLVLRTEDVWQRYNHFRSVRGSQSGFPLLTPIMETYDGPAWRLIVISWSAPFQGFARCQGFPFSPLQCRQDRTRMRGGVGGSEAMCSGRRPAAEHMLVTCCLTAHQAHCLSHARTVAGRVRLSGESRFTHVYLVY